jgi:hypothetical protein
MQSFTKNCEGREGGRVVGKDREGVVLTYRRQTLEKVGGMERKGKGLQRRRDDL